ncbi:ROK family transcriptional regulator [Nocardioides sp. T2.26MG-1]|uniref:ROK family transcriptional regulator n=1 Tax=Nocardioides sp. T2.26MG-1 TaxID=3041166 RepID=UPI00247765A7|nr:ROK family transcriptional regulator [Nocardioides sp. T2.26MG-1]CAI9403158.1 N-acetylglucosamine repressor [Nocardioides sp. T2.26MG-1]
MPAPSTTRGGDLLPAAILGLLGSRGSSSRADIARLLRVSPAAVTQATKSLIARGLVAELEAEPSRGGRPARLLGLVSEAASAIGVKVTADHVATVRVTLDGLVEAYSTRAFDPSAPDALDRLGRLLAEAVAAHEGTLLGVGVGVPGSVDSQASGVVTAPTLGWAELPVGAHLRAELGVPVLLDNDVNTLAAAERLYGVGQDAASYVVVTIGRGIGCGVVVDGSIYRGARGGAGEIGHIPVADGPDCACGGTGCLEALIGEDALVRRAREEGLIGPAQGIAELAGTADDGVAGALEIFATAGRLLGRALAGVVHTIDPGVVVIQGEGVTAWRHWQSPFETSFRRHLMPSRRSLRYQVHAWSEQQWTLGAASLVLAAPFDSTDTAGEQGRLVRARLQDPEGGA